MIRAIFCAILLHVFYGQIYGDPGQPRIEFVENKNQWEYGIQFVSQIEGGNMILHPGGIKYYFVDYGKVERIHDLSHDNNIDGIPVAEQSVDVETVDVKFVGCDPDAVPTPFGKVPHYYNFFRGNDSRRWAGGVHSYAGIYYDNFYDQIDLKIYEAGSNAKYDFILEPGADPNQIQIEYAGALSILKEDGDVVVSTQLATIREKNPVAYQYINGKKTFVDCDFILDDRTIRFYFPSGYDACYELVIDPVLIFSTYSGSTADNWGSTATPGEGGTLYSAGVTLAGGNFPGEFPTTPGVFQRDIGGLFDIGILKYDSTGGSLLFASYLGGISSESAHSLIVNSQNELVVLGTTSSNNYPTSDDAFDRQFTGGTASSPAGISYPFGSDIVLTRISKDGTRLLASSYIGGSANDGLNVQTSPLRKNYGDEMRGDVITDENGNIYVSSVSSSFDFPAQNSFNTTYVGGLSDAIVMKFDADISQMLWGAFLGGDGSDASHTIKFDSKGDIFLAGGTSSEDFPTSDNAYMTDHQGDVDGWIAHIKNDGSAMIASTLSGTSFYDQIYFLDLNSADEVFVYGQTNAGLDFPILPSASAVYNVPNSGQFLQKFSNSLEAIQFSTCFGSGRGDPDISPTAFMVNDCDKIYMAGWGGLINRSVEWTQSSTSGLQVSSDAIQKSTSGSDFYFIVLTGDASEFVYGTFLGGNSSRTHVDGGTSRFQKNGVVYHAVCSGCRSLNASGTNTSDFPTTPGAWSRINRSNNCNNAAFKLDLSSLYAIIQTNSTAFDNPGLKFVCLPDSMAFENNSVGGKTFTWDFGDDTPLMVKDKNDDVIHAYKEPGTYTVTLKVVDNASCNVEDITSVTVDVFSQDIFIQDDDAVCEESTYELNASGGEIYRWRSEDGSFIANIPRPTVAPVDTTLYYVTVSDQNGCSQSDSVLLAVIPKIIPEFTVKRAEICDGRPFVTVESTTDSLWVDDQVFFDFGDESPTADVEKTNHTYDADGVYEIVMTGRRKFCTYETSLEIPVFSLKVPNVITPDESGKNDVLTIQFGEVEGTTPADYGFSTKIKIYNRWGTVLFETDDYQYNWNGEGQAAGIYFFEAEIQDHATCKTWLHVIK